MSGKPPRVLSDATIKAILERRERDERGEVPSPEDLLSDEDLLAAGWLAPDMHFLSKRVEGCRDPEKLEDTFWRAIRDLLKSDIPLSRTIRDLIAGGLAQRRRPDPEAEKRARRLARAHVMRADLEIAEAINRQQGDPRPRSTAKDQVAKHWKYRDGEALRKALKPSRLVRRKPR
jgi:hypothetical protein